MSDLDFSLTFKVNSSIYNPQYDPPEQWITQITGEVFAYGLDIEDELVGRANFFYVDLDSSNWSPFDLLDTMSETEVYINALYGYERNPGGFKDRVCKILDYENWSSNVFILDRIEILPIARGQGVMKGIIDEACRLFSAKADVMALKLCPLQHEKYYPHEIPKEWKEAMKFNDFEQDETKANEKLALYYQKLGFKTISSKPDYAIMAKLIEDEY